MIIERSARVLGVPIYEDAALEIARRSRELENCQCILRRVRDFAEIKETAKLKLKLPSLLLIL